MEDSEKDVQSKIKKAYCPLGVVEEESVFGVHQARDFSVVRGI